MNAHDVRRHHLVIFELPRRSRHVWERRALGRSQSMISKYQSVWRKYGGVSHEKQPTFAAAR